MKKDILIEWLNKSTLRKNVILHLRQPMTALQIIERTELTLSQCSYILGQLALGGLVMCLNPLSGKNKIYWLTTGGVLIQKKLLNDNNQVDEDKELPNIDWELYSWVCYRHRSAVIKALTEPMQPSMIKRKAYLQSPKLTMSANNVRDVVKQLLKKNLVRPVKIHKKVFLRYELTDIGKKIQCLLLQAEKVS